MDKTQLVESKVEFDEENHIYWLNDIELSGITSILSKYLFPDMYSDVPKHILEAAAARGSKIHKEVEIYDNLGIMGESQECKNYAKLKSDNRLNSLQCEYLISDNENFATMIDKVFEVEENLVDLGDVKTTYKLKEDYLSWQLSINAYLFELQNPGVKVRNLYGIWLRGDIAKIVPIMRVPDDEVERLLHAAANNLFWAPKDREEKEENMLQRIADIEQIMIEAKTAIDAHKEEYETLRKGLLNIMESKGIKKWETDKVVVTYKAPSTRSTVDSKSLQKEYPDIYIKHLKTTAISSGLIIKIKNDE